MNCEIIKNCELYLGDCMDLMKQYPDKYFDISIVDPPYLPLNKIDYSNGREKTSQGRKFNNYKTFKTWNIPDNNYFIELCRVSKEQIIWGINYFHFENLTGGRIVWDKKSMKELNFQIVK